MISISYLLQFLMLLIISPATWAAIIISKRFTLSFLKICGIAIAFFALLVLFFFIKENFRISLVPFMWCAFVSLMSIWVMLAFQKYEAWVKLKHLAICSFFVGFFFYTNYNMPFFQQVFSHYFYASTDAKEIKGSTGFSCVTVNVVRGSSIFDQNQYVLLGGYLARVEYEYEVKNKKYTSATKSYSKSNFYCEEPVTTAYFFPLFPSWSIANNDLPEEVYWENFYQSNLRLMTLFAFAVLLGAFATKKQKSKKI